MALTGFTVYAACQPVSIETHIISAMVIATIKAAIVTLFFMHLYYESKIVWGIVIYPLFIFTLIILGTMGDASVKPKAHPLDKLQETAIAADTHHESGHASEAGHH